VALSDFIIPPPGGLPTPTPTPPQRHTGDAATDRLLDAMTRGDWRTLAQSFTLFPEPCVSNPQGVGSRPKCPAGTAEGGTVQTARVVSCERAYVQDPVADLEPILSQIWRWGHEVYAVFGASALPSGGAYQYSRDFIPDGDIVVVLREQGANSGQAWHLAGGQVVGVRLGCGTTAAAFVEDVPASAFLLSPLP
jgi:hypothetical protein